MLIGTEFDHRSEMRQVFFPFQFGKVLSLIFGVYGKRIDGYWDGGKKDEWASSLLPLIRYSSPAMVNQVD